jgi:hypothetical protein
LFRIAPGGATDLQIRKENGVTLGRPRSTPDDVVARIVRERAEGKTSYAIARDLNKDAVPTAQGARLVASHGPRVADAGRRSLLTAIADCAALT